MQESLVVPIDLSLELSLVANKTYIGLPFHGLTLPIDSNVRYSICGKKSFIFTRINFQLYLELGSKVYDHYFGSGPVQNTTKYLNDLIQMTSGMNFFYAFYEAMLMHKNHANTFCYQ